MAEKIIEKVFDSTQVSFKDLERQPTAEELCSLRWIKTPCSYASLGSTFTLLQQDIMLQVSARLQRCINQYYDQMRYKRFFLSLLSFLKNRRTMYCIFSSICPTWYHPVQIIRKCFKSMLKERFLLPSS